MTSVSKLDKRTRLKTGSGSPKAGQTGSTDSIGWYHPRQTVANGRQPIPGSYLYRATSLSCGLLPLTSYLEPAPTSTSTYTAAIKFKELQNIENRILKKLGARFARIE